jgi:multidrug efflux pump subunit AcrA (membrane-fusion protein)
MKTAFAIIIIYLLLGAYAFGLTPEEKKLVGQMRDSISLLRAKVEEAQSANDSALSALSLAATESAVLTAEARTAAAATATLAAERDQLASDLSTAATKYERLNARYQQAQLIIALVSAFFVGLLALQFTHNLQPPYGLLVPLIAGAAAFFAIYIIL